jgi:AraC family transcriptional regulator
MVARANVIEKDILNLKGSFTLKNSFQYLESIEIYGIYTEVNENDTDFEQILDSTGSNFLQRYSKYLTEDKLYSMVSCHGDDSGKYTVFFGGTISKEERNKRLKVYNIPEGWYACFRYYGDMLKIRNTFVEDLYRWLMRKEIELCPNGIGMLDIYNLSDVNDVSILVPVKALRNTARNVRQ